MKITSAIFLLWAAGLFGQTPFNEGDNKYEAFVITPVIGAQYDFISYKNYNDLILLNHYSIVGGVQLYERLNVTVNLGYMHTQHLIDGRNKTISVVPLLMGLQYRFLKDFWISPSVRFDAGGVVHSNVKNQHVNSRLEIETDPDNWGNAVFSRWGAYISPQFSVSFKIKNLYIDLGAGYGLLNYFTFHPASPAINERRKASGIQLKAGVIYRLNNQTTKK